MDRKSNPDEACPNEDIKKILAEIKAFDQMQTSDRLRQWLENPVRLPKEDSSFPKKQKRRRKYPKKAL